jgi:DNA polymerase-3 subunit epsilon
LRTFCVIDVETANYWEGSICQVGLACYHEDGTQLKLFSSLVDPECVFNQDMIEIHGISAEDVSGAPTLAEIADDLFFLLNYSDAVVSHSLFDRRALIQALPDREAELLDFVWLDTTRVARRAWEEVRKKGYALSALADRFDIEFKNHDALEDAVTTAKILFLAMQEANQNLAWWVDRAQQRCTPNSARRPWDIPTASDTGFLLGHVVCFTGDCFIPRRELAEIAATQGATVVKKMTKKVTLLVSGEQDASSLRDGETESSSYRKAEERGVEIEEAEIFLDKLAGAGISVR